ncbi:MAG TPA: DNA translocase FtsK 4TM domain-containing protein, partial [Pseudonocardia sp.]|nr:DNA translocase FtsK 4TM domain-containing protein [Pseudonocardia sp.]
MAGRTTGRGTGSRVTAGRSERGTGSGGRTRKSPGRRTPAPRRPDLLDRAIDGVGRGVVRAGRGMGRAAGRTRELEPAHRRDGLGVVFLVLSVVTAAGGYWGAGGPVGRWLSAAAAAVVGLGSVVLPVLLAAVGLLLMLRPPRPEARPRLAVGSLLLALGGLGIVHLAAGSPREPARWAEGGGAVGYLAAVPLTSGLTVWVAAPVLVLLVAYALLVLTATPVREVPTRLRRLLGRPTEESASTPAGDPVPPTEEAPAPPPLRRPARRRQASRESDVPADGEHPPAPD